MGVGARRRHPEKLHTVQSDWDEEMCRFEEWALTQVPQACKCEGDG